MCSTCKAKSEHWQEEPHFTIDGLDLFGTCTECPEQYNVFIGEKYIGYLHLRHGCFSASMKGSQYGEHVFYSEKSEGNGRFEDAEREGFLTQGVNAMKNPKLVIDDRI